MDDEIGTGQGIERGVAQQPVSVRDHADGGDALGHFFMLAGVWGRLSACRRLSDGAPHGNAAAARIGCPTVYTDPSRQQISTRPQWKPMPGSMSATSSTAVR